MVYQCIYKATNNVNNKVYIGIASNFKKRKRMHLWVAKNSQKEYTYFGHFQRALRFYGSENFTWDILLEGETVNKNDEIRLIAEHQSDNPEYGYNLTKGGDGNLGWVPSEETRKRISEANMGNKSSVGRVMSEETRRKISNSKKGKPISEEHKQKLHAKGYALCDPNIRAKAVAARKASGYKHSEETKRKIGEKTRARHNGSL